MNHFNKIMQLLSSSIVISILTNAILLLHVEAAPINRRAAPQVVRVRFIHYESGKYITVDPSTGNVAASTSKRDDTTLFMQYSGPSASLQFMSVALEDRFLSLTIRGKNSTHYGVNYPQTESSGQSGSSSGSGSTSDSGSAETGASLEDEVLQVYNWQAESPDDVYSTLKTTADGRSCYLAFEITGEPVSDPCSISRHDSRAAISIDYV